MLRVRPVVFYVLALGGLLGGISLGQEGQAPAGPSPAPPSSITPLKHPPDFNQVREYLRASGEGDSFKASWIAAVEKNRSVGAPYWPEEFWKALKDEMQNTDVTPMYLAFFQDLVTREQMQQVIDAYHRLGKEHFKGSPECFMLGNAIQNANAEFEKLELTKTQELISKVYDAYKTQIKAARARYLAEHPDYVDK